jgi:hypothetical protein
MNKLHVFGCSFTKGSGCLVDEEYTNKYKKEGDHLWTEIIAKNYGLELVNKSKGGLSNDKILDRVIKNFETVNEDDYVIIQLSFYHRYDIPNYKNDCLLTIAPNPENLLFNEYTKSEIEHITYVSTLMESNLFKERHMNRFMFIRDLFLNVKKVKKIVLWRIEDYINDFEKIVHATNHEINDHHWTFEGHRQFAKRMNYLIDNNL